MSTAGFISPDQPKPESRLVTRRVEVFGPAVETFDEEVWDFVHICDAIEIVGILPVLKKPKELDA